MATTITTDLSRQPLGEIACLMQQTTCGRPPASTHSCTRSASNALASRVPSPPCGHRSAGAASAAGSRCPGGVSTTGANGHGLPSKVRESSRPAAVS